MPQRLLLLFAHPAYHRSRANRALRVAAEGMEGVTLHDLYETYPDFLIDVDAEQARLAAHDVIVVQHPFYWSSARAIVKEWLDLVLTHGWAFGPGGTALAGKTWMQALAIVAAVGGVVAAGRLVLRPVFRWIARSGLHEIFTAFALALVVGVALLMQSVGLSAALGVFVAGVVLADSEFRHEIEGDIDPFRGLLLGLFFITVGASIDLALVLREPLLILGVALGAIAVKAIAGFLVALAFRHRLADAGFIGLALAESGEFALVLFSVSLVGGILAPALAPVLTASVVVSMMLTPLLVLGATGLSQRLMATEPGDARAPEVEEGKPDVIVAGYGRFGQAVGQLLSAMSQSVSVLDHDAEQVDVLRGFGRKVNYGDALRLDLLRLAGAGEAKVLVVAIDDRDKATELVEVARRNFPHLKIAATPMS